MLGEIGRLSQQWGSISVTIDDSSKVALKRGAQSVMGINDRGFRVCFLLRILTIGALNSKPYYLR